MKQINKHSKLILSLIMLVVAVLCAVNVTYSYFTSVSQTNGEAVLKDLDVKFIYQEVSGGSYLSKTNEATIELFSASGPIERNVAFKLSFTSGGTAIHNLGIMRKDSTSATSYVRFWIDAYISDKDGNLNTTTNYGKYFIPTARDQTNINTNSSSSSSWCYYTKLIYQTPVDIGNELTLSDLPGNPVPATLLGEKLKIYISFEAVQMANKAFLYEFDDEKGYSLNWT